MRSELPEDAATGVAAAALGAYLTQFDLSCRLGTHESRIAQGYAMGAPSVIEAIVDCADAQITSHSENRAWLKLRRKFLPLS